ncbi:tyrosine-type recombinase/integrase [uncultured Bilophila sp.]|uniref:tyrosine-type recombinase/integrase n=1 Tax=uncultured Bilophila sp. TaxID=529385 RepID=UPI0035A680AC
MSMYALRHVAASKMLANGVDIAAVTVQLGHKNITTTGAFYTHALASSQRRTATCLPDCTNLVQNGAEKTII